MTTPPAPSFNSNTSPEGVLRAWISAVNDGSVEQVVALYAEDAVLLSTFSAPILFGTKTIREYFERLAARPGLSVTLHDKTLHFRALSGGCSVASGIYCFRFEVDGELLSFEARFTFVIEAAAPHPIVHHQSAQIPRALS